MNWHENDAQLQDDKSTLLSEFTAEPCLYSTPSRQTPSSNISSTSRHAPLLTRELQSKALLAGEEVCGELQADSVEGAVRVLGQHRTAELPQQDSSILGPIPDAQHVVDLLRVENQEMQTVKDENNIL